VSIKTDVNTTVELELRKGVFLGGPCRDVISRTFGAMKLVLRQSPTGKNVSTETEDIVEIRHQATTGEDFMCAVVTVIFGVCNSERLS
jgi:hypothetical protein